jgi:hypothetical protein
MADGTTIHQWKFNGNNSQKGDYIVKNHAINFLLVGIIIFSMVLPVSADENLVSENGATILEQIKINSGIKPTDNIFNTELYTDSLKGYNFQNDTILKVYPIYFWENADKDFDTMIDIYLSWAKTDAFDYIVFRENILRMRELRFKSGKVTVGLNPTYPDQDSLVWKDIINSSVKKKKNYF